MPIDVIASEIIYHGRAFNVRRDKVRFQNQNVTHLDIIEHTGAVTILPLDADGRIIFVRQYRHAAGRELLELPAGTLERDEQPEFCALREIREETGFAAGKIIKVGEFFLAPGYSTEYMTVFLATDLTPSPLPGDADEFITIECIPIEQAYDLVIHGGVQDGKSVAALLLARPYLSESR
jgi:ADP-ribose pyrophosphatase